MFILREPAMLTNEMKRKVFMKLRNENYLASLRLEGLPRPVATVKKDEAPPKPGKPLIKDGR